MGEMERQRQVLAWVFFGAVAVAFGLFGLWLHSACVGGTVNKFGWVEIAGLDSEHHLCNWTCQKSMMTGHFRHPLIGIVMAPVTALAMLMDAAWAKGFLILFFAFVGAVNVTLVWRITDRLSAAILYLSFAYAWILGGIVESFGLSECILLLTLYCVKRRISGWPSYFVLAGLAGGVTISNIGKPLLAWAGAFPDELRKLSRRFVLWTILACLVLGGFAFGLMVLKWRFCNGYTVSQGVCSIYGELFSYLEPTAASPQEPKLPYAWHTFFLEPMVLHGPVIGKETLVPAYGGWLGWVVHPLGALILTLMVWAAAKNWRMGWVRALLLMVAVDVGIHLIVGWGIYEGQIYCGHWFFAIPLLLATILRDRYMYLLSGVVVTLNLVQVAKMLSV